MASKHWPQPRFMAGPSLKLAAPPHETITREVVRYMLKQYDSNRIQGGKDQNSRVVAALLAWERFNVKSKAGLIALAEAIERRKHVRPRA